MRCASALLAISAAILGTGASALPATNLYDSQLLAAVQINSLDQVRDVESLAGDIFGVQRQTNNGKHTVHVRGTVDEIASLREHGFALDIVSHNIARYLADAEAIPVHRERAAADSFHSSYHSYAEIIDYLKGLAKTTKNPQVTYGEMNGATYEGRKIPVLAIGNASAPYAMYLQGNLHAREWVGSAGLLYATEQLIKSYPTSPYANKIRIYISPMANPDGYEYSRTTDRLWRGNRSPSGGCDGVDLNRNFNGFDSWVLSDCGTIYGGPSPYSENETKAISSFLNTISKKQRLVGIIDFHSFAQWIMWPPGYAGAPSELPDGQNLESGGNAMKNAIQKTSGVSYTTTTANDFYPASGAFDDWSYDKISQSPNPNAAVDKGLVYTIELPPMDGVGNAGFIVPPEEIVPIGKQVYTAIDTLAKYILANNVPK